MAEKISRPIFTNADECHHYRNADTNTHKVGVLLSLCAERVVMLSATPFNLRSSDLFNQLNMLNPALFPDEHMFNILIKQIRNVNQSIALLRKRDVTVFPELLQVLSELQPMVKGNQSVCLEFENLYNSLTGGEVLDIPQIIRYEKMLNLLNPIASSFTRTLKRDAISHRVTREVRTLEVHFTNEEYDIYRGFIDVNMLRHQLNGVSERAFGLITNGLERIAASSIVALERNINHFMHLSDVNLEDNEVLESDLGLDATSVDKMLSLLKAEYQGLIHKIHDVKIVSRMEAIKKLSELRIREHQNNLIGANTKDAERLHKAIAKEQKKTVEKLRILEEKRKLGSSSFLQGIVLLEII